MKKRLNCFLIILLLASMLCPTHGFALGAATVKAAEVDTSNWEESIKLDVDISGNPGLCCFDIMIGFDTDSLYLDTNEGTEGCRFGVSFEGRNATCVADEAGCRVTWVNISNVYSDGTMFSLFLKPYADTPVGDYSISVSYVQKNTVDEGNHAVLLSTENGVIRLREPSPTITGSNVEVFQGDTFTYSVSLKDNPGIAGYRVFLHYDKTVFSPEKNGASPKVTTSAPYQTGMLNAVETEDGCQILWMSSGNVNTDGELFSISFAVSEQASPKDYSIVLSYSEKDTLDEDGQAVAFSLQNGSIHCARKTYELNVEKTISGNDYLFAISASELPKSCSTINVFAAAYEKESGRMLGIALQTVPASKLTSDGISIHFTEVSAIKKENIIWKVFALSSSFVPIALKLA